jgi:cytochrome c oxidase subunit II
LHGWRRRLIPLAALLAAGCNRQQSALAPFGEDAGGVRSLTIVLVVGAVVIAAAVAAMMAAALRAPEGRLSHQGGMRLVLWAGGVVPTVVLASLLIYSLPAMRPAPVGPADLRVRVEGQQFWWRVVYRSAGGTDVEAANELRLPVGRRVLLELDGGDVIHSFWVPGLAGKMDMIPGRTNKLPVRADRPGRFRGVCTEFCGLSHALMAFDVVAMEPAAFDRWLAGQARPAAPASTDPGAHAFAAHGCGGCHQVRGTGEGGRIGPDLTHLGSRATLGAGTLRMTTANLARFIKAPNTVKPGVRMPAYPQIADAEAVAIARYLQGLK